MYVTRASRPCERFETETDVGGTTQLDPHYIYIPWFFALGACVGSFLNVVVWRLPRNESIVSPPSHCPKCNTKLAWYDNIPIFGWLALRGKCRYCALPISARYPTIEAFTGLLFISLYAAMFIYQEGPSTFRPMTLGQDWPIYVLYLATISGLLASSLIDAEMYIIPIEIPWFLAVVGIAVHGLTDRPNAPGALNAIPQVGAVSAGAAVGLLISILMLRSKLIPQSFADGGPLMEVEKAAIEKEKELAKAEGREPAEHPEIEFTPAQIRGEMRKEMLFLMPPMLLGGLWLLLTWKVSPIASMWQTLMSYHWLSGMLGAIWGGLIGALVIWLTRIAGSYVFGREAMGLGDVHLMLGIGAVIGAAGSVLVFFIAPFVGLLFALYKFIFRQGREVPYGPFLSVATLIVMLFYGRIYEGYLAEPTAGIIQILQHKLLGE